MTPGSAWPCTAVSEPLADTGEDIVHSGGVRRLLSAALWVVFTLVAVATGLGAVSIVRTAVTGTTAAPLSADQVAAELAAQPAAPTPDGRPDRTTEPPSRPGTASPTPSATSPTPSRSQAQPDVTVRTLASRGGTVVASCEAALVYLRSWSPAEGFVVDEVDRGPASEAEVRFTAAGEDGVEVTMRLECSSGSPVAAVEVDTD